MSEIRVGIADAHFVVREGLKYVFSHDKHIKIAGECSDGKDIPKLLKENLDLLVFDYDHADYISFEDLQKVFRVAPDTNVLVISAHTDAATVNRIIRQPVKGLLSKECSEAEILDAVRATAKGDKFYCNRILDVVTESKKDGAGEDCSPTVLSQREIEVVEYIAQGLTAAEVADKMCLSVHTINTHRKNIFKKLGVNSTTELVRYALKTALI
ncbi:MAG: response regulator transcription factor [Flavobacteriales bacterium]|nr:response regulator transcription factor [Flavobacteriales bacterium]